MSQRLAPLAENMVLNSFIDDQRPVVTGHRPEKTVYKPGTKKALLFRV